MRSRASWTAAAAAIATMAPAALSAQTAGSASYTRALADSWNSVKRNVAKSATAMPEASYAFKPSPDVRTFGQILGHLANEHYLFCSEAKAEKNPKEGVDFEKTTAKAQLVTAITDSIAYCDAVYASLKDEPRMLEPFTPGRRGTPFSTLLLNVTHDGEHYGNFVTYLRMKGIVPPSSAPAK